MSQPGHNPNRPISFFSAHSTRRRRRAIASAARSASIELLEQRVLLSNVLAGQLDTTFGVEGDGIVGTPIAGVSINTVGILGTYFDEANGVAVEPGGKIVVVGTSYEQVEDPIQGNKDPIKDSANFAVARYLPDGTLDPSFGDLITDFTSAANRASSNAIDNADYAYRVTVLPNNDILVVGTSDAELAVAVYDEEGGLINKTITGDGFETFGDAVFAPPTYSAAGAFTGITFYAGGSIYNAGDGEDAVVYKETVNFGSATNATFAGGGTFTKNFQSYSNDFVTCLAVDSSGNVLVGGESDTSSFNPTTGHTNFFLMRLSNALAVDTTFNSDGVADVVDFGSTDAGATSLAVQSNGDILAAGWGNGQGAVLRFLPSGVLDPTFGARGVVPLGQLFPTRVAVVPDGQILVMGGDASPGTDGPNGWGTLMTDFGPQTTDTVMLVDQLNNDGTFDSSFGNTGQSGQSSTAPVLGSSDPEFGGLEMACLNGIYDNQDGKIVMVGTDDGGGTATNTDNSGVNDQFILAQFIDSVQPPTSTLAVSDINTPGETAIEFTVTYADSLSVDVASIGNNNILVTGPNGYSQAALLLSTNPTYDSSVIVATYQVTPTDTAVSTSDNGTYTVTLEPNQISDDSGNFAPQRTLGNFVISVGAVTPILPTAALTDAPPLTSPGTSTYDFIVTYNDSNANIDISYATLNNTNILVTGPGFYQQAATLVSAEPASNAQTIVAIYSIPAPGNSATFNDVDNGAYTINMQSGTVGDTYSSPDYVVGGALGQFTVDIAPTNGTTTSTPPLAVLTTVPPVVSLLSSVNFLVTYTDANAINFSSLGDSNILIDGPNLYSQTATFVSAAPATNSSAIVAEYSIHAPLGESTFTTADNGNYVLIMQGDEVSDTDTPADYVPLGVLGQATVNIAPGTTSTSSGNSPITSTLLNINALTSTASSIPFSVQYTDATPISIASLASTNILVDGPNGFGQYATFISSSPASNSTSVVANYDIVPPTGSAYFGSTNNGSYVVILEPGQVADTANPANYASVGLLGQFQVNIAAANNAPPIAPTATLTSVSAVVAPVNSVSFTVTYTDSTPIVETALSQDNADILVTGPNSYSQYGTVAAIQTVTNGWAVTYTVNSPGTLFTPSDDGIYDIALVGNKITDEAGQTFAAAPLGTINVNIQTVYVDSNGVLTVNGTNLADSIEFGMVGSTIRVLYNNTSQGFPASSVTGIYVNALGGNDTITVDPDVTGAGGAVLNATLLGGPGDDTINGGWGADSIGGGKGNNVLFGGPGNDTLVAGNGSSLLRGGKGDDLLKGGVGNDTMHGGMGNNTFFAGKGDNLMYGGGTGEDVFYANNGYADTLYGGGGTNIATVDMGLDVLNNIQTVL
jgi:uncharacterized delta-60 repeat protein